MLGFSTKLSIEYFYKIVITRQADTVDDEKHGFLHGELNEKMEHWVYGCDICQDICPWNRFSSETNIDSFHPRKDQTSFNLQSILEMKKEEFSIRFKKSPVKRTKLSGLQRNAKALLRKKD